MELSAEARAAIPEIAEYLRGEAEYVRLKSVRDALWVAAQILEDEVAGMRAR